MQAGSKRRVGQFTLLSIFIKKLRRQLVGESFFLLMPLGCPTIQVKSDTVFLDLVSDPTSETVQLQKTAPNFRH